MAFLAVGRRQAGGMLLCVGLVQGTHLALGGQNLRCLVLLVIPVSHNFGSSNLLCKLPSDTITVHVSSARGKVPPAPAPSGRKPFWSGNHQRALRASGPGSPNTTPFSSAETCPAQRDVLRCNIWSALHGLCLQLASFPRAHEPAPKPLFVTCELCVGVSISSLSALSGSQQKKLRAWWMFPPRAAWCALQREGRYQCNFSCSTVWLLSFPFSLEILDNHLTSPRARGRTSVDGLCRRIKEQLSCPQP